MLGVQFMKYTIDAKIGGDDHQTMWTIIITEIETWRGKLGLKISLLRKRKGGVVTVGSRQKYGFLPNRISGLGLDRSLYGWGFLVESLRC